MFSISSYTQFAQNRMHFGKAGAAATFSAASRKACNGIFGFRLAAFQWHCGTKYLIVTMSA